MIPPKHAADLAASADSTIRKNWQEMLSQSLRSSRHISFDPASPDGDHAVEIVTEKVDGHTKIISMTVIDEAGEITEEMIEEILGHPPKATEIAQGVTLFTKDGTHTGNAIVVQKVGQTRRWSDDANKPIEMLDVWLVETDFGNQMRLTEPEIHTLYTLGRKSTYSRWFDDRLGLIAKRTTEL